MLVERRSELAELDRALHRMRSRHGGLVLVEASQAAQRPQGARRARELVRSGSLD
jgi:hypothetical protein